MKAVPTSSSAEEGRAARALLAVTHAHPLECRVPAGKGWCDGRCQQGLLGLLQELWVGLEVLVVVEQTDGLARICHGIVLVGPRWVDPVQQYLGDMILAKD